MKATTVNGFHAIASDIRHDSFWLKAAAERGDLKGTYIEDDHFSGVVFNSRRDP